MDTVGEKTVSGAPDRVGRRTPLSRCARPFPTHQEGGPKSPVLAHVGRENPYTRLRRIIMTMAMTTRINTTVPMPMYTVSSSSRWVDLG